MANMKSNQPSTPRTFVARSFNANDINRQINNYTKRLQETSRQTNAEFFHQIKSHFQTIVIIFLIGSIIGIIITWFMGRDVSNPIAMVTEGARRFSRGDIELAGMDWKTIEKINNRRDELGDIGRAFSGLIEYQNDKVSAAEQIAAGNLAVDVNITSDQDKLGGRRRALFPGRICPRFTGPL